MKYIQRVFERLSRGGFISSDSVDEDTRNIFLDLDEYREEYSAYFAQIGFILEEGNGYFYFSRKVYRWRCPILKTENKKSNGKTGRPFFHYVELM